MVILTSEDFARDLKLYSPPLFEIILPMTESAEQLIFIQKSFRDLAHLKSKMFSRFKKNTDYIRIIPLFEGVDTQIKAKKILKKYLELHKKTFGFIPQTLRVFIARSDPAMVSGLIPTVFANKIALSDLRELEKEYKIKIFPIIGAGALPFRGGLNPSNIKNFSFEYPGISTITVQSAFRYDYPLPRVKQAIKYYIKRPFGKSEIVSKKDRKKLVKLIPIFEKNYQYDLNSIVDDLKFIFESFPARRERHLHIGLLAYGRKLGKIKLPRAITFTGSFYSLGVPPEFLGIGTLSKLSNNDLALVKNYYNNCLRDIFHAGKFLNWENLENLGKKNSAWQKIAVNIKNSEKVLGLTYRARNTRLKLYAKLTSRLLASKANRKKVTKLIAQSGILRKSLG